MIRRTIQAPGIELRETDKSQYNKQDYSIVGTTSLICGFASKGENYIVNWINTLQNFEDVYGKPETEEEKYFYNASYEVLRRGGILLAAKLPYSNESLNNFSFVQYKGIFTKTDQNRNKIPLTIDDNSLFKEVKSIDNHLSTYMEIVNGGTLQQPESGIMSIDELDRYRTSTSRVSQNTIKIIDITKTQYKSCKTIDSNGAKIDNNECIGIMPVIVTPINALFYQNIISSQTSAISAYTDENDDNYDENNYIVTEITENLSNYQPLNHKFNTVSNKFSYDLQNEMFASLLASDTLNDNTVSKEAVSYFPLINFSDINVLDSQYLKQIGVVVFEMYNAQENSGTKIAFRPVESFIGSLDRNAKDNNNATIYIDTLINTSSRYINFFSNFNSKDLTNINIIGARNLIPTSLGFTSNQCQKTIDYNVSILQALNLIFDNIQDKNRYNVDLVVDGGVSNIAYKCICNNQRYTGNVDWKLPGKLLNQSAVNIWKSVLNKYITFCQYTRKDCIFIADGLRDFCLDGNSKRVRNTKIENTVENAIIPYLKYMTGINSSYAAGYCNWYLVNDAYSGEILWLPPSIKAAGVYIYTDAYFNKWDAPAGMTRGVINTVLDVAFSPNSVEAEKIYLQNWNYAISYPIDGIVIEGQKTFQIQKTAFDRINVRRLFLYLEKEVARRAKYFLYEGNTEYQREKFVDTIKPIFEYAATRNGILEYYIKCDEENNTPQTIENNEMRCSIAVKPVKTIEYIVLNFVCTNQSADVVEVLANN